MAKQCIKCGKTIGALSPDPLNLENGEFLCYDCSEVIKDDVTKLYGSKTVEEFEDIKKVIISKCKDNYDEKILVKLCILIDSISKSLTLPHAVEIKPDISQSNPNNSGLFSNIGHKIKNLAKVITWVGIIFSVLFGLITLAAGGIIIMIVGPLISWISSFTLYGFGQLIENSDKIVELLKSSKNE